MSAPAVIMMIVVCALVWGGFAAVLSAVWKIEKRKRRSQENARGR